MIGGLPDSQFFSGLCLRFFPIFSSNVPIFTNGSQMNEWWSVWWLDLMKNVPLTLRNCYCCCGGGGGDEIIPLDLQSIIFYLASCPI